MYDDTPREIYSEHGLPQKRVYTVRVLDLLPALRFNTQRVIPSLPCVITLVH
jgi:hypothetical protein